MSKHCLKIAIDGGAATGKTTVSRKVAQKLDAIFVNSGLFYRYITLVAKEKKLIDKENELLEFIKNLNITFFDNKIISNPQFDNNKLTSIEVSDSVSIIAKMSKIRDFVTEKLREIINKNCFVVMEGRDITTIVMPNANFKFFLTVSTLEAAKRRFLESSPVANAVDSFFNIANEIQKVYTKLVSQENDEYITLPKQPQNYILDMLLLGEGTTKTFLENISSRNAIDSKRKNAPLLKAKDAIEINTDNKNVDQVVEEILNTINEK